MKFTKKVIGNLNKCYSIAPLFYRGCEHFLVAGEKKDPCLLFDPEGNLEATVWEEPGGVMTMVQIPGSDGCFLATWKFYSPNDSTDACLVLAVPKGSYSWEVRTVCKLPFVHRFDLLQRNGKTYLIACTLKSAHAHKDDWSSPGKVYACELPCDLTPFDEEHPLPLIPIKEQLTKNHGFYRTQTDSGTGALISSQEGVFLFTPPCFPQEKWDIRQILFTPASDAAMIDLDNDGKKELIVISPFHGSTVTIYKEEEAGFMPFYSYKEAEFAHAIWCGAIGGENCVIIGHRKGAKALLLFRYQPSKGTFESVMIDENCGPANVTVLKHNGRTFLVSANRESDEIAVYDLLQAESAEPIR